jgi:hypothetical protein
VLKTKIWANFQRIIELFTQKYGFGIRDPEKTYSGSGIRKKPILDPGSRIRIRNTVFAVVIKRYIELSIEVFTKFSHLLIRLGFFNAVG